MFKAIARPLRYTATFEHDPFSLNRICTSGNSQHRHNHRHHHHHHHTTITGIIIVLVITDLNHSCSGDFLCYMAP